jgi:adenylate cyclase class 2
VIEAELKARLSDPARVRAALDSIATAERVHYQDRYFDTPAGELERAGRELRLRTIHGSGARHVLTFKEPAVEQASQSKPEHETQVAEPTATTAILQALGYLVTIEFGKNCANYRFRRGDRDLLATVVSVDEIDGEFLEVETPAGVDDLDEALVAVREVMAELGVDRRELTTDTYTDAVRAARLSGLAG